MTDNATFYGGTDAPLSNHELRGGDPNVTGGERWLSILAGGTLATYGVKRGGPLGILAAFAGSALVARGARGQDPLKRAFTPSPVEAKIASQEGWSTAATAAAGVSINKPRAEVYAFWRDFSNLPKIMKNLESIEVLDAKRSIWRVKGPGGRTFRWTSTITEETPGHIYRWRSEGDIANSGSVEFRDAPKGHGTEVALQIAYEPPLGQFGRIAAKFARMEPQIQARMELKRFKMMIESGEVSTGRLNPTATNAS